MGAWGAKAFENDSALDWLVELEAEGVDGLRDLLVRVAETDEEDYLDVDDGAPAIAAAEIVAAATGCGRDRVPEAVLTRLSGARPDRRRASAILTFRAANAYK